jgi:hypothetical protein
MVWLWDVFVSESFLYRRGAIGRRNSAPPPASRKSWSGT